MLNKIDVIHRAGKAASYVKLDIANTGSQVVPHQRRRGMYLIAAALCVKLIH